MFKILFLYNVTPDWLRLSHAQRRAFNAAHLQPLLERYGDRVQATFCDAESFNARVSDFAIFDAARLEDFYFLIEELRDTPLYTQPYIEVKDIVIGLQDGFQRFQAQHLEPQPRAPQGAP